MGQTKKASINSVDETVGGVSAAQLKSYIERLQRLDAEKKALAEDRKEIISEAKAMGFDGPTINELVKQMAKDKEKRSEQLELFDIYAKAIGFA